MAASAVRRRVACAPRSFASATRDMREVEPFEVARRRRGVGDGEVGDGQRVERAGEDAAQARRRCRSRRGRPGRSRCGTTATRCSDEPWVQLSGLDPGWMRSSPTAAAASSASSTSPSLEVALLEHVVGPHAGVAVGLELDPHGLLVRLAAAAGDAEQVLHVVADLVGDHVGLGEVAGGAEAVAQLVEEAEVDVGQPVGRAVEGPDRRATPGRSRCRRRR